MKNELIYPFQVQEKRPLLQEGVFYLPQDYGDHEPFVFPLWTDPKLFGRKAKVMIEYCSGNGSWIVNQAKNQPDVNWIAVEYQFSRLKKIWALAKKENLMNLFLVYGEALSFTTSFLKELSVSEAFINFPDPWPKRRHEKNRIMNPQFISELARVLEIDGKVTFVTDHEPFFEKTCEYFSKNQAFGNLKQRVALESFGDSFFEILWRKKGKKIQVLEAWKSDGFI